MTTSSRSAYVWVWLPGATEPVVAGRLDPITAVAPGAPQVIDFVYGQSYFQRPDAIPLYLPELPLEAGRIRPREDLSIAGVLADAAPDAWGRRVVLRKVTGWAGREADLDQIDEISYLLESGSDRTGALDFQARPDAYVPRGSACSLDDLVEAAARIDEGTELRPELREALLAGSSLGGARPKVGIVKGNRSFIVKLSSATDTYPVVQAEALAMELARRVGITAAQSWLGSPVLGRDVLFVERFDRQPDGGRRMMVSALTLLELPEHAARYATYPALADIIIDRFTEPTATLHELYRRIVFNICVGNTDDHARNHAAFWHPPPRASTVQAAHLTLTPAFDICPQLRTGGEAAQAMAIGRDGYRMSQLRGCLNHAETYRLTRDEAREIIDRQLHVIRTAFAEAADAAALTEAERHMLWGRQILNLYALDGYG